jgi:hypothetical protein
MYCAALCSQSASGKLQGTVLCIVSYLFLIELALSWVSSVAVFKRHATHVC